MQPEQQKDANAIYQEIVAHITKQTNQDGGKASSWYVGIAKSQEQRLHTDHKVPKENHWFIIRKCANDTDARAVEAALHKNHGCDGDIGGGDATTVLVYAYLKAAGVTDP